jgi:hypothetical protein
MPAVDLELIKAQLQTDTPPATKEVWELVLEIDNLRDKLARAIDMGWKGGEEADVWCNYCTAFEIAGEHKNLNHKPNCLYLYLQKQEPIWYPRNLTPD